MTDVRSAQSVPSVRVVLVDDERLVRDLLRSRLEGDGFEVVDEVTTAATAQKVLVRQRPDVVVIDVHMSGFDASSIVREVVELLPGVSVVVYSALSSPMEAATLRAAGAEAVADKADGHMKVMGAMMLVAVRRAGALP